MAELTFGIKLVCELESIAMLHPNLLSICEEQFERLRFVCGRQCFGNWRFHPSTLRIVVGSRCEYGDLMSVCLKSVRYHAANRSYQGHWCSQEVPGYLMPPTLT